jgi:Rhodopirellula transposase DDE domain
LPSPSTMAEVLNHLGFRLRRVVKAKPQKKIKETDAIFDNISNNSPLPLIVTLASFGCMSPEFKGIRNCICVYEIIALTHLTPFYQMQRPFREKKHSALGNPFSVEVRFHVSA